ncbi:hypothetical protein FZW96_08555 [Bacillus sp. BGMRC 2118]|nr:hypothetical protein FZW96_08555 [Bacillus sp. BGMRC 2118]
MRKIILFTLTLPLILNIYLSTTYAEENSNDDIITFIDRFLPQNARLINPEEPKSVKSYQFYDFDQNGQEEIIITFEIEAKEQPNPSQYGVILLSKVDEKWTKTWDTQIQGVGLHYSNLVDITGDGIKEYLFGVTIGASAGNKLGIFKWNNNSLKLLADVPYHMMDVLTNKNVGIAVWRRYIADTYFVDVLKWNGKKMITDEELYSEYYPEIEQFYQDKISKMDAWFYWYTLADAQIHANLFDKAAISIKRGVALANELSMPEVVEIFNQLNEKLDKKRNSNYTKKRCC